MKIYYYIVSGGELREVVLGVYGGKGAGKWCSALGLRRRRPNSLPGELTLDELLEGARTLGFMAPVDSAI